MTPRLAAPPAAEIRPRDLAPVAAVQPSRPVLSPARPRARLVPGWSLWLSLGLHVVLLAGLAVLVQLRPPPTGIDTPRQDTETIEYIDLAFPTGSVPGGSPASAPQLEQPDAGLAGPVELPATPRGRNEERGGLRFPRQAPSGLSAAPATGGGAAGATGAAGAPTPASEGTGGGSAADGLRPGYRDSRLYVETNPIGLPPAGQKTDRERYMEHLQARIDAVNDSAYAATSRPNTDWTTKDKGGRRWGVSDKGIHLGPVTIPKALVPLPRGSTQREEEAREEQRQRDEIRRQEDRREIKKKQDEAIAETRRRKEAERKKEKAGGGGEGGESL